MSARLLSGLTLRGALQLDGHLHVHGPLPAPSDLIAEVRDSGLTGRGGSGFPTATKLAAVAAGSRPVVVVNGTEGEPMSAKDDVLMRRVPHLVLDGAEAAARAVGAREIVICAGPQANRVLGDALAERRRGARWRGPRWRLVARATGYVAGEETAVLAHLEGRPPRPRLTPPRPAQQGLNRRPTLVQNVETLAHVALIARHGAAWFRRLGTEDRPGTTLVTVSSATAPAGVHEVAGGTRLAELVRRATIDRDDVRAVLVGGYFGAWLGPDKLDLSLDDHALRPHGAAVGAGVVVVLSRRSCAVAETARLARYLASQSAGQCGPCVHGLAALADVVGRFAVGRLERDDGRHLGRWIDMVHGRGACAHPDGVARMLTSAVREFRAELEYHAAHGPCPQCATRSALLLPGDPLSSAA